MSLSEIQALAPADLEAYLATKLHALEKAYFTAEVFTPGAHWSLLKRSMLMIETLQRELARREEARGQSARHSAPESVIPLADREGALPLSFTQQRLWFLDQLDPGKSVYNEYGALHIQGELNLPAFERSINEIIRRHESLRTLFVQAASGVVQTIVPHTQLALQPERLLDLAPLAREARAIHILEEEVEKPFDLSRGPLFRLRLLQLRETEYVFLLVFHHSIGDGWSLGIFYRELSSLYEAYCQHQLSPLKELQIQYADFAAWQQEFYQESALEQEVDAWARRLQGAPLMLDLPLDKPRPAIFSNRGTQLLFSLPASLKREIKRLCQSEGVTLFMVLFAALESVLYRYTGQEDMLIGTTLANRSSADLEALIGFFANTSVLRGDLSGNPTFRELLHRAREAVIETYEHQHIPFERLVTRLQAPRDLSHTPLFQVMLVLQNAAWLDTQLAGCEVSSLHIDRKRATFDLVLSVVEGAQELQATLEYNTDLFEPATIERLAANFQALLQRVVAEPDLKLAAVPLLAAHELQQVLTTWNETTRPMRHTGCIHQLFEEQALAHPQSIAVVHGASSLTYEQLNQQANQLAHYLRATFGVKPEALVGICMPRSSAQLVAVLGVLKAGGAYIPLDPMYPQERLEFILDHAGVSVVLTEEHLQPLFAQTSSAVVCLDARCEVIAQHSTDNPVCEANTRNLVYVIYTSGSTGEPKGVQIEHASLLNLIEGQIDDFSVDGRSRVLQFVSFSFDVSVEDIFMSLCAGATLCLVPTEMMARSDELYTFLREQRITSARIPPTILATLPDEGLDELRTVISGGESWSAEITARWSKGRRFFNEYGPTEATICTTRIECRADGELTIGRPLPNTRVYILDAALQPVPIGVPGELFIGGAGLARAYLKHADLTAASFLPDPFSPQIGARMYKTGDRARYLPDGTIKFLERIDQQVKVRGFRIELGEIEAALMLHPQISECSVVVREDSSGTKQLSACCVLKGQGTLATSTLRAFLKERLPVYMLPAAFVFLDALPLSPNGKVDRKALALLMPGQADETQAYLEPRTTLEQTIAAIWREVLQREKVGLQENYFDLGGHSLNVVQVHQKLQAATGLQLSLIDLFTYPTIQALSHFLSARQGAPEAIIGAEHRHSTAGTHADIAIIGMAGRFPQAATVEDFWHNLRNGVESVITFSEEEVLASGIDPAVLQDPHFVPAGAILEDVEWFDAAFFQYSPRDAEIIDPQQRLFLESSWEALEDAGYDPESYHGKIAVYGGQSINTYLHQHLQGNPALANTVDDYQLVVANGTDFLTTRVSYKLSLRGPSVVVQTACSTSLVAVHLACESLRAGESQIALAGGVSVRLPQKAGYLYKEGGIMSPDGHCRAFDEQAQGFVGGEGVGIVVLKRLEDALADGDNIRAIIKGSAINNDGATKVGFTAPGVQGQMQVISEALTMAEVDPASISYIETHGTGTNLGDAIEISALRQAYQAQGDLCALGSVKTNVGHLDAAAGVTGLIKTVQALEHATLPPSLHFHTPNPNLDLEQSRFYVNAALTNWERKEQPRRAGVSSFGIGGTNAHVILEEAPARPALSPAARSWHVLPLSARSERALRHMSSRLAAYLRNHPDVDLADVAYTLQVGRKAFTHRQFALCRDVNEAIELCDGGPASRLLQGMTETSQRPVVFLFPGQGAQYVGMGADLYREEGVFRAEIDRCAQILLPHLGRDIRALLYPPEEERTSAAQLLAQTSFTQPALFALEYALSKLWISWGVRPVACIGHSIGEYVAACLSGVFELEAALELVAFRGQLMQELPAGAMLAIPLSEQEVLPFLQETPLSIAAVNTSTQCVVAGPLADIESLEQLLRTRKIEARRLRTSHAFHSQMMEPMLAAFTDRLRRMALRPPVLPYISNVTGTWITQAQATDPDYWVRHTRAEVRFADGLRELLRQPEHVLLEVGPGQTLSDLARQQALLDQSDSAALTIVTSLRRAALQTSDVTFALTSLGRLWISGVAIDWAGFHAGEQRRRVSLPAYPFERKRYWIERLQSARQHVSASAVEDALRNQEDDASLEGAVTPTLYPRPELASAYVAPRNEVEQKIAAIWQRFLGVDTIGIYDDFFDLGGSSLLATLIISHLQTELQSEIPLRELFEALTIAELAERVEHYRGLRVQSGPVKLSRAKPLPLSFAQQRIWLDNQLKPGNPLYNIAIAARLTGPLRKEALEKSLQAIVARHEALRTHFVTVNEQVTQVIASQVAVDLPVIDLRPYAAQERAEEMQRRARELATQPFHLAQGPLFRFFLFGLDDQEHVLLLSIHHMIADGWSLGLFFDELVKLYPSMVRGTPANLPDLPIQYADFASWQRQWLQGEALAEHLAYWRQHLHGSLPVLDLPTDHPRPPLQTYHGAHLSIALPPALGERLKQLSQQEDVTLFMVLLAAFQLLLSRYTGLEDILVGTPIAGRNRIETEHLIGNFIGALVLRTDLSGNPTFKELLRRVREVTLAAYAHQDMPFEHLVEALQPRRDPSRSPLFQVLLRQPNVPAEPMQAGDLTLNVLQVKTAIASHDITLDMLETPRGFIAEVEYNTDLFAEETIARFLQHWQTLLLSLVENQDQPVREIAWLAPEEQSQLLTAWNEPEPASRAAHHICEIFEAQVQRTPEAIAVSMGSQRLTYYDLNLRANQLAHYLRGLGIGPDVLVGVCLERSLDLIVALLGILKAGGAYVPLDPRYPAERLLFMLEDAQTRFILTQQHLKARIPEEYQALTLYLDSDWEQIARQTATNPLLNSDLSNLAYTIYTSGSTGRPKGVMVTHAGLYNLLQAQQKGFFIRSSDRLLQFASINFDASVSEVVTALCTGAQLCLAATEELLPGPELISTLRDQHISVVTLPPSVLAVLPPSALTEVGTLIVAGEACPAGIVKQWAPGRRFINAYGPTENTVCATLGQCQVEDAGIPPIGKPIEGVQVYLLDPHLQLVPVGVPGEIYLGGIGLARGYLRRPDLTAERFIPHPFSQQKGARLYKTGDIARYRADGRIEFLGRADHQVKIRGFRIEPGEIEAVLLQYPAVQECVVVPHAERGDTRLVAYFTVKPRQLTPMVSELRAYLQERLPEYMVPAVFLHLEAMPLTPSEKIDRQALPDPKQFEQKSEADAFIGPRNPLEELLAAAFADILGVERVGAYDNFFELGGHSLLATRLVSQLVTSLRVDIPVHIVFEAPTVADLAPRVEQMLQDSQGLQIPPIESRVLDGPLPLSFAQQRIWFMEQLQADTSLYAVSCALRINRALNLTALERSLQEIMRRHDILRATVVTQDGQPMQIIQPEFTLPLPVIALDSLSVELRHNEVLRLAQQEARQPFELARGPLVRTNLLALGQNDFLLLLTLHNLIADGWSREVWIQELVALYQMYEQGSAYLPALPVQYTDYLLWQRQWMQGALLEKQLAYWRKQLEGIPSTLNLPLDRPRPALQTYHGSHIPITFSQALAQRMREFCQGEGITLFMFLLASFNVLLARYSQQDDIVVGTPVANRNRAEIENLVGFFANTLVLRTKVDGNLSIRALLAQVREMAMGAYAHQDLPFEKLVEVLRPERDGSRSPLFQVMFTLQNGTRPSESVDWLWSEELHIETQTAKFDLNVFLVNEAQNIAGQLEYNTDLFDTSTIMRLLQHWQVLLEHMLENPEQSVAHLLFLTGGGEQELPPPRPALAISATFTAEPIQEALAFWLQTLTLDWRLVFAPYHQVFQQLLDAGSLLAHNRQGSNLLLLRFEDWLRSEQNTQEPFNFQAGDDQKIEKNVRDLLLALGTARGRSSVPYLFCICPPSEALREREDVLAFFQRMEEYIVTETRALQGVEVITSAEVLSAYPTANLYDPVGDELGHVPYTSDGFTALATIVARRLFALLRPPYKVIAVDCDNTLWRGVCGEDGPLGVIIEEPHRVLQEFLLAQQQAGMLICLCSKNNEEDVLAVFRQHPEMHLREEHLAGWRINWQAKSTNLRELARELQLDVQSFIFLDDNPLECAEVEANTPQVLTCSLADKFETLAQFLRHMWAFDQRRVTEEDQQRTAFYQANRARGQLQREALSYQDFLTSLDLRISISAPAAPQLPRVAQLTQRTNQFNLTTRRYSEAELQQVLQAGHECLVVTVSDRFGDYGLVGVLLFAVEGGSLVVDTFLLSCRAMGRGVEHHMLRTLSELAGQRGLQTVVLPYHASGKNKPARDFLEQVGSAFKQVGAAGSFTLAFPTGHAAQVSYSVAREAEPGEQPEETQNATPVQPGVLAALDYERSRRIVKDIAGLTTVERIAAALTLAREPAGYSEQQGVYSEPCTPLELALAEIWQQLLHVQFIGLQSNFFALGGHSLLATQLLSRIASVFQVKLPLQSVFEAPTLAQMAAVLQLAGAQQQQAALQALVPVKRDARMPLSFAQQRLWFLHQLMPESASYIIPLQMRLQGVLNIQALEQSLREVIARHEILRTTFDVDDGQPFQVISPAFELLFPLVDLCSLALADGETEMLRLAREESQQLFNLTRGPLIRATLCRLADEHHVLLITVHHIVFDAWSGGVLSRELMELYEALSAGRRPAMPALPIQYADFAFWQQQWLQGELLNEQVAYWHRKLRGAASLELPVDHPEPVQRTARGKLTSFAIPKASADALRAFSQQADATLFMTLLAAFQLLLHRYSEQEDIVIGTDIANRTREETEGLIGFFVNLLVVRSTVTPHMSFKDLLGQVRATVLEAYAHQEIPFEKIVDALQLERSSNQVPLVRALFVLQNVPMPEFEVAGLVLQPVDVPLETTNFDLGLFLVESEQGINVRLHYRIDLFEEDTIARLVRHFMTLVESIIAQPDAPVGALEMYTPEEKEAQSRQLSTRRESQRRKLKTARRAEINF